MKSRQPCVIAIAAALTFTVSAPVGAQWVKYQSPGIPRTADGKPDLTAPAPKALDGRPDLSGIWRIDPAGYAFDLTMDLKAGEAMPWADALFKKRSEEFGKDYPGYRCVPSPGPLNSFGLFKIIQSPTVLAILPEDGTYRQIHTDGRRLPQDPNPTWMGYSVGTWNGDSLVVESAGFNDQSWLDFLGHPHTEALRVTERFRRRDFGHMEVQMTFEDSGAYVRPWTITLVAELNADTELLEYVCNENERSVQHFVVTDEDRQRHRTVVTVPREVLATYVGVYELISPVGRRIPYTVSLPGDQLIAQPPGGGRYPLVPTSPTTFTVAGTPVEFFKDAQGVVTHFIVRTVEGDQKAMRQAGSSPKER